MFERRLFFHVDWLLLSAVLLLAGIGLTMIYSTTYVGAHVPGGGHAGPRFWVQLYATGLGFLALLIFLALDYRFLAEHSLFLFCALVALLIYVLVGGVRAGGSTRWISLGARNYADLVVAALFFFVPFVLIAKQPDLGTAVTLIPVCFGIAYLAGLRLR